MLWEHYVYRRGSRAEDLWEEMFSNRDRDLELLFITGHGFDIRSQKVLERFIKCIERSGRGIESAELALVKFAKYELTEELHKQTEELHKQTEDNVAALRFMFGSLGSSDIIDFLPYNEEDEITSNNALREGSLRLLSKLNTQTDVVLDVSSLPRIVYLSIISALLSQLIPKKQDSDALFSSGVNFQILVAEDAELDGNIRSEDPSSDIVLIPGFATTLDSEGTQDWPLVWFPILGENRSNQLAKVLASKIPDTAEVCPVLPHPSRDPRRADELLVDFAETLFDSQVAPLSNVFYVHESHPFEAYRQLYGAMDRYRESMQIIEGCRLVVTPLASKLITVGACLACFDMKPNDTSENYGVAIPYAEPTRYSAKVSDLSQSDPVICSLVVTGDSYKVE